MNGTGRLAIQGVDYPATVSGFFEGGSASGAQKMAALINSTVSPSFHSFP
jgi:cutinase